MGTYGLRINNYQAGSIYGVMQGIRTHYDYSKAMWTNSLFLDYMEQNGLNIYKDVSTRDLIGVQNDYGTRSYEEDIEHLEKTLKASQDEERTAHIKDLIETAHANKDKYEKTSKERIREIFYEDGCDIYYDEGKTKIHYKMLYRSAAKAKKGTVMMVNEKLYDVAKNFLYMGIELPEHNAPIVEVGAYASLVSSTIIDKIQINPKDVLILKDVALNYKTNVISVETDKNKHCRAVLKKNYVGSNDIFDGQALIDLSIFPDYGNGYVLLRQHFTKCAALATDIQGFFKDYFRDEYDTAMVKDMWGNFHRAKDIKMITTNNAIKWIKFDVPYDYWCDIVLANGGYWGIVKTAHESKLGDVQRMSYQMINTLSEEIMDDVMQPSREYIKELKTDTASFVDFLRKNATFSNDYEVLVALYEQDHTFEQCDYFRARKSEILRNYIKRLRNGKLIQDADNMTIFSTPYAMLLHAVGEDVEKDTTLELENGVVQCYTERFADGEYLAGFRSPHNSCNNILYFHNHRHPLLAKYFRMGNLCIAVNMKHTDVMDRGNGLDFDSDSAYVTNRESIVEHAKMCYKEFPTIVNNIHEQKRHYDNTLKNYADIDNQIAAGQLAIGESSNVAQTAQAYRFTFGDKVYDDSICILSVLAQVAIDSAKRLFEVDVNAEIARIKNEINVKGNGFPAYWKIIATNTRKRKELNGSKIDSKINHELRCPMNHVFRLSVDKERPSTPTLPIKDFYVQYEMDMNRKVSKRIENMISKFSMDLYNYNTDDEEDDDNYLLLREDFDELVESIRESSISSKYMGLFSWLINRAFMITPGVKQRKDIMQTTINKNKSILLKVLFEANPEALLKCFSANIGSTSENAQQIQDEN